MHKNSLVISVFAKLNILLVCRMGFTYLLRYYWYVVGPRRATTGVYRRDIFYLPFFLQHPAKLLSKVEGGARRNHVRCGGVCAKGLGSDENCHSMP